MVQKEQQNDGQLAYAVLSLVSVFIGLFVMAVIFEPAAVIFGLLGAQGKNKAYSIMSIAGVVCGALFLIFQIIALSLA